MTNILPIPRPAPNDTPWAWAVTKWLGEVFGPRPDAYLQLSVFLDNALPRVGEVGEIIFVQFNAALPDGRIAYSDGVNWRRSDTGAAL